MRGWRKHYSVLLMKIQISKTLLTSNFPICIKNSKDIKTDTPSIPPTVVLRLYPPQKEPNMFTEVELQGHTLHAVGNKERLDKQWETDMSYVHVLTC